MLISSQMHRFLSRAKKRVCVSSPEILRYRRTRAFTLLELLVSIAIVGILSVLTIGITKRVLFSARNAGCISNLRQYGVAFNLFAAENNNRFPKGSSQDLWFDQLAPYVTTLNPDETKTSVIAAKRIEEGKLRCPAFSAVLYKYYPNEADAQKRRGYQYNRFLQPEHNSDNETMRLPSVAQIQHADSLPVLWDTPGKSADTSGYPGPDAPSVNNYCIRKYRHEGKINLLMVSGAVISRLGKYDPNEEVPTRETSTSEDIPFEKGGIDWRADGKPFYWRR